MNGFIFLFYCYAACKFKCKNFYFVVSKINFVLIFIKFDSFDLFDNVVYEFFGNTPNL